MGKSSSSKPYKTPGYQSVPAVSGGRGQIPGGPGHAAVPMKAQANANKAHAPGVINNPSPMKHPPESLKRL